jgi:hypothetical protein
MIYLASPYSHPDEKVREERYLKAMEAVVSLLERMHIYSPIVHCHHMAIKYAGPTDAEHWREYNEDFIRSSTGIIVLCIEGWKESIGVRMEVMYAVGQGIPVKYLQNYLGEGAGWALLSATPPES